MFEEEFAKVHNWAKARAASILSSDIKTIEDALVFFKFVLARQYNMPLHHQYFQDLTLPQLMLEYELLRASKETAAEKINNATAKLTEDDKEDLFADMIEEDSAASEGDKTPLSEDEMGDLMKEFMQTGKFFGE